MEIKKVTKIFLKKNANYSVCNPNDRHYSIYMDHSHTVQSTTNSLSKFVAQLFYHYSIY